MNYTRSRYRHIPPIGARYADAIGQGLLQAAQRLAELRRVVFLRDTLVRVGPRAESPVKMTLPAGSSAFVVRTDLIRLPTGWLPIETTTPGAQGLGVATVNGWVSIDDLDPASPYLRVNPPPPPAQGDLPIQTAPGGTSAAPSTLRSVAEFLLLTAPAWGSFLYTRLAR